MDLGASFAGSDAELLALTPEVIDVDQWLRAVALATMSGAPDQYGGASSQHDVQFYVRPADGRAQHLPHDLAPFSRSSMAVVGNADLARPRGGCDQLGSLLRGQDFDAHCRFVGERAAWVRPGSDDAAEVRFPPVPFRVTTNDGDDLEVDTATVALEGRGWIAEHTVEVAGEATVPTWLDDETWRIDEPLAVGENDLTLRALDLHGAVLSQDGIRGEGTGG
jgi:hypothetical protein